MIPGISTGGGGFSGSSSAGGSGDVLFGDTSFGNMPVINLGAGNGGGLSLSRDTLLIGGAFVLGALMLLSKT